MLFQTSRPFVVDGGLSGNPLKSPSASFALTELSILQDLRSPIHQSQWRDLLLPYQKRCYEPISRNNEPHRGKKSPSYMKGITCDCPIRSRKANLEEPFNQRLFLLFVHFEITFSERSATLHLADRYTTYRTRVTHEQNFYPFKYECNSCKYSLFSQL